MLNICLFCKYPFTAIDVIKQDEINGHQVTKLKCHNCGAEYKMVVGIERGPTKTFIKNEPRKPAEPVQGGR